MFELAISIVVVVLIFLINNYWFTLGAFLILIVLIGTGLYSMFFGAPFVASSSKRMKAMLELAGFKKSDKVADLGCGDGRVVHMIANEGVSSVIGYEYSLPTYLYALWKKRGLKTRGKILFANFWKKNLTDFDVLICFLLGSSMERFRKEVWPVLRKGTRVISNEYMMEEMEADKQVSRVYLYIKK